MTIQRNPLPPIITAIKPVWVAWTNTDLTEGRGWNVPRFVCESRATALRLGHKQNVQGCDAEVRACNAVEIGGCWFAPTHILSPSREDSAEDDIETKRAAAIAKAKAAGLTDEEIKHILAP